MLHTYNVILKKFLDRMLLLSQLKLRFLEGHWSQEIALSATGEGENLSSDSTEGVPYEVHEAPLLIFQCQTIYSMTLYLTKLDIYV